MKKKIILRISIILIPILLLFTYFNLTNKKKVVEKEPLEPVEKTVESSNIIKDVNYTSKDASGNEYYLEAEEGIIDQNKSDIIFLTNVKAVINLKNYEDFHFIKSLSFNHRQLLKQFLNYPHL